MSLRFPASPFSLSSSQELNEWDTALGFYERVLDASRRINGFGGSESEEAVVVEAQIRRCDLLHAQEHLLEARACWEVGGLRFSQDTGKYVVLHTSSLCWFSWRQTKATGQKVNALTTSVFIGIFVFETGPGEENAN